MLDTNVFVSYFWGGETIGRIFDALFEGRCRPVVSDQTLAELREVGLREKFRRRFSPVVFQEVYDAYREVALHVHPRRDVLLASDVKDNTFLECAAECQADYLVTGDSHLLRLVKFENVKIVTPAEFVESAL